MSSASRADDVLPEARERLRTVLDGVRSDLLANVGDRGLDNDAFALKVWVLPVGYYNARRDRSISYLWYELIANLGSRKLAFVELARSARVGMDRAGVNLNIKKGTLAQATFKVQKSHPWCVVHSSWGDAGKTPPRLSYYRLPADQRKRRSFKDFRSLCATYKGMVAVPLVYYSDRPPLGCVTFDVPKGSSFEVDKDLLSEVGRIIGDSIGAIGKVAQECWFD